MQGKLSLRERLVTVMVISLLPVAGISLWGALREGRAAADLTQSQVRFAASLLAANQGRSADAAEQMLGAIALLPGLRTGDRAQCQGYFDRLRARYPMYTNIGLLGPDGQVLCHALGTFGDASATDRDYFREAVVQRRFVMGEPIVGRLSGRRALPFALPVIEGDQLRAVAFATLDLERAAFALSTVQLPEGAQVLVADRRGTVLMEYPPPKEAGEPRVLADPAFVKAARTLSPSAGETSGPEGNPLIEAYAPSRPIGPQGFVVRVGIDKSVILAGAAQRRDGVLLVVLMLLAAMVATWFMGGRMIVKPAKQILGAARRLEQGNLDARVPLYGNTHRGEFARLAGAFNLMAESLQMRQLDLQAELGRSRAAYDVLDQVLNSMQEGLVAVTANGKFLMFNAAAARLFPLDGPPVLPQLWPEHFGFFHADGLTPYAAEELPLVRSALGESGSHEQIFVRNMCVPEGRLLQCSWQPIRGAGNLRGGLVVFTDVTLLQRLQVDQAVQFAQLKDTQRRLVEAQRVGRVGNWELDLGSGRLWWSDEVYGLFGLGPGEFDGTINALMQRVHPEDRALLKPARDSALRDAQPMNVEYRVVKPDGAIAWMQEIAEARRGEDGEPVWFGGVVQDITPRKMDEQALRQSQRELQDYTTMLQRAAEAAQAITAQPGLEQTTQAVADQARFVIGARMAVVSLTRNRDWSQSVMAVSLDARYEQWRNYDSPPDGSGIYSAVCDTNQALRLTQAQLEAHPRWRAFGAHAAEHMPLRGLLAVPLTDRAGTNIGLLQLSDKNEGEFSERDQYVALELAHLASIAIENARLFAQVRDLNANLEARITERTAELARQELLYRTLAEQAPEVIWNTDGAGERLTFLNRAWYELVGGTPADWLGHSGANAIHPDDRAAVSAKWRHARNTLTPFVGERRLRARDGTYHTMSFKGMPVLDERGEVAFWVGIDADITEFKAIESALRSSNREIESFSYSVSHDLRAPLGAVAGFSRALETKLQGKLDERAAHYLARIHAGVGKMEQLIEALLSLAKVVRAPIAWTTVDLGAMAREAFEGLQMEEPNRNVEVRVADGLQAHGDARLLRVLVDNLVGNAWKFTSRTEGAVVEVGRLPEGGAFFVRDNGVGFDMAYASKLFTAFQRLHSDAEFPGTGIGLATVNRVVARHQGRVWAESEPGKGTTFYFSLSEAAPPAWLAGS